MQNSAKSEVFDINFSTKTSDFEDFLIFRFQTKAKISAEYEPKNQTSTEVTSDFAEFEYFLHLRFCRI